jgi:hypothetical protein
MHVHVQRQSDLLSFGWVVATMLGRSRDEGKSNGRRLDFRITAVQESSHPRGVEGACAGGWEDPAVAIEALDILYVPSRDVAADLGFYRDVLGARVVFAIEAMGTRVAEVATSPDGPRLVLADHLAGDAPVLLHRVSNLDETLAELTGRGLRLERRVELPLGPCATIRSPGGQRLGLYQLTRPQVDESFAGRADF